VPWSELPPPPSPPVPVFHEADWKESFGRAYLYWTPHKWLALSAEYLYEKFERAEEFNFNLKDVKTQSFPLGIKFFHPSGFYASLRATYWKQDAVINRLADPIEVFSSGDDSFWLFDAAIGYRLPKRYGFITVGATNLFDKDFKYADTDFNNNRIQPGRFFFAKVTLAIP
jgi:outer membrane receptor protein involved in Fe transport